jgi:hypothetical protein
VKKLFATIFSMLFVATVSFAVVGCTGNEEQKPEEAAIEAPAPEEVPIPEAPEPAPEEAPVED